MSVFIIIIAFLVAAFFLGTYIIYRIGFYSSEKNHYDIYEIPRREPFLSLENKIVSLVKELDEKPFEWVWIKSYDGLKLAGRYYHVKDEAPVDICFHGWRGNGIRDFCGGSKLSFELGHNVLIVEQRGQGASKGHVMTYGVKEKYDVLSWIDYVNTRFGTNTELYLYGVSMGAATVLMACGLELPANVKAVIADCPYALPAEIIKKVTDEDMKLSFKLFKPLIYAAAFIWGGFNLGDRLSDCRQAVKKSKLPILIIHGEADKFVPCWMSRTIAEANPELIRYESFPGADHGISYMVDTERYEKIVKEFLKAN